MMDPSENSIELCDYRRKHCFSTELYEDYISIDDVRIYPSSIVFSDAYDGKQFSEQINIINSGKSKAYVRVLYPTSKAFIVKPIVRAQYLSAGMSIKRTVLYTFTTAMAISQASIPIYINEKPLLYNIEVCVSMPRVSLNPKFLDFGEIDVGNASEQLSLQLSNSGHKTTVFVVDLGRNNLEILVNPMKGKINPNSSIDITVELLGTREGPFNKEFWIKTEPPQRVRFLGTFIEPKLQISHPVETYSLTLINFPKTYYGAKSSKILVIRNHSSRPTMFCTVAEFQGETLEFKKAQHLNNNLKHFSLEPREGRLIAKHLYVLTASYVPKKTKEYMSKYHICFIRVNKVNYRDGFVAERDMEVKTFSSTTDIDVYSVSSLYSVGSPAVVLPSYDSVYVRLCLYGETEQASVTLTPDAFEPDEVIVNKSYVYTFNIKNNSKHLPITYKYNKLPYIEMEPQELSLGPRGSVDVTLTITPKKLGKVEKKIEICLLYTNSDGETYNVGTTHFRVCCSPKMVADKIKPQLLPKFVMGITPDCNNEVGYLTDNVRFNTNIKKPIMAIVDPKIKSFNANNSALIAFPNDRPRSLRPWVQNKPIKTIFKQIPRNVDNQDLYKLRHSALCRKWLEKKKYIDFLRISRTPKQQPENYKPDYETTRKDDMQHNLRVLDGDCSMYEVNIPTDFQFIPLPPEKLMKVLVKPKFIVLGQIAAYTSCTESFSIQNYNEFPVHITVRALSYSILIKGNKRIVIAPNQTKDIVFECLSFGLGKYYVPVYIIVNDAHIFDATVFAEVVPMSIRCYQSEVNLVKNSSATIEIMNPVNCNINFMWEVQDKNFIVIPDFGYILPRKSIICTVKLIPVVDAVYKTEIYLISQSGAKQIIKVICQNEKIDLGFSATSIAFENMPLNETVMKYLIVRNTSQQNIFLEVVNPTPRPEISVTPREITLKSMSNSVFKVIAHFQAIITFQCKIIFRQQNLYEQEINVFGNVAYPDIIMSPNSIQFAKAPSFSHRHINLQIVNNGVTRNTLEFDMSQFPGTSFADVNFNIITGKIILEPQETKHLLFQFQPTEPVVYAMFLPCILNGILGPPLLNNPKSLSASTYYIRTTEVNETAFTLPLVRTGCTSGTPCIKFSSLCIDLKYSGVPVEKTFSMTNLLKTEFVAFVSLRYLGPEFRMSLKNFQGKYKKSDWFLKVLLQPEDTAEFVVDFRPEKFGIFKETVPILLDIFKKDEPFNFLKLNGHFPRPEIKSSLTTVWFQTVLVETRTIVSVVLNFSNHKYDCMFYPKTNHSSFTVAYETKQMGPTEKYTRDIQITFHPKTEQNCSSSVDLTCTCDCFSQILVKASATKCKILLYKTPLISKMYPYYIHGSNSSDVSIDTVIAALEGWLFSQCFFCMDKYLIPTTISRYPFNVYSSDVKDKNRGGSRRKKRSHLPIVQLLVNIIDKTVLKYFNNGCEEPNIDDNVGMAYDYNIYKNVLKFLEVQEVFVDHIRPEFLLTYERYSVFKKSCTDKDYVTIEETLEEEDFNIFTKLFWTELILRIYQKFSFETIISSSDTTDEIYSDDFQSYFKTKMDSMPKYCDKNEFKLMKWVEFHFEKQRNVLIRRLDQSDMRIVDSKSVTVVSVMTLVIAYCPYTLPSIQGIYESPSDNSQILHNSFILKSVLKELKMSYKFPSFVDETSELEQIMFLTYLYNVLPSYYPSEELQIEANLGATSCRRISLTNTSGYISSYSITFFNNEKEEFSANVPSLTVVPQQTATIKISYSAKNVAASEAILVLTGERPGQKYTRNKVYKLVGLSDITHFTEEYTIRAKLYTRTNRVLNITSPCGTNYIASTYIYFENANAPFDYSTDFISVAETNKIRLPRQVVLDESCVFGETGVGRMQLKICFVASTNYKFFLYFINQDAGIFCVKINMLCQLDDKSYENIDIHLPTNFNPKENCKCQSQTQNVLCPLVFNLEVPCRNHFLMNGFRELFKNFSAGEEYEFWSKHLVFPKGLHLLRTYMENTFQPSLHRFRRVLSEKVTYTTEVDSKIFAIPKTFVIDDVTSGSSQKLTAHCSTVDVPNEYFMTFRADHGSEIRKYKLSFKQNRNQRINDVE